MGKSGPEAGSERKAVRLSLTQPSTVAVAEVLALPLAPLPLLLDWALRCAEAGPFPLDLLVAGSFLGVCCSA